MVILAAGAAELMYRSMLKKQTPPAKPAKKIKVT
jgi:hypothetical protein